MLLALPGGRLPNALLFFSAGGRSRRVHLGFPLDARLLELAAGALNFHGDVPLGGCAEIGGDRPETGLRFGLRLFELRGSFAFGVGRGLPARLGDRLFVFLFERGELLIERPAQLGLQVVQGHQVALSHKPNGDS